MNQDTIHREIAIEAGIHHLWTLISRPGFWIGDVLCFDNIGVEGDTVVVDVARYGRFPVRIERLIPPCYAAYRWASAFPGAVPTDGNSTLVEFSLTERDHDVLLRVTESGFASLAVQPSIRAARFADNTGGWERQLALLQKFVSVGVREASP